jgi:F0F1-type ATP synthase assembly protein I
MRKMGATEIKFDATTNQIIIKSNSGEQKINIVDSGLSQKLQQELKSTQEPITFNQVDDEFNKKKNKNDRAAIIGAILIVGIILAVVIGVVIHKNKKRNY